jgi:hypothetical protein
MCLSCRPGFLSGLFPSVLPTEVLCVDYGLPGCVTVWSYTWLQPVGGTCPLRLQGETLCRENLKFLI